MTIAFSALVLILMIVALADMITMDPSRVKHLPKMAWIIIVILIPFAGGLLWFLVGRQYAAPSERSGSGMSGGWSTRQPTRSAGPDLSVRDAEAELAALDREIAAHERAEHIRRLEAELEQKRREKGAGT